MREVQKDSMIPRKIYVGGAWIASDHAIDVINPATEQVFARVHTVDRSQVKAALTTAEGALPGWRGLHAKERGALLHRVADEINRRKNEIARAITRENGKPLAQSEGEVAMAEDHLHWLVIEGAGDDALCMSEETFAPVAPISSFETEEEAIRRANETPYGLSSYAMTRDIGRIFRLAEQIEAGTLGINDGSPSTSQSPIGGVKQSGWGRELGVESPGSFCGDEARFHRWCLVFQQCKTKKRGQQV
jgi:acyl-CoA reductase-like NAD-dependent aldehyde dehydrogenase